MYVSVLGNTLCVSLFQVLSDRDAQLLLKDNEELVMAVYDYWLAKRLRLVSCTCMCIYSFIVGDTFLSMTISKCNKFLWAYNVTNS